MPYTLLFSFPEFIHEHQTLLFTLFIGAIAGFIAQLIVPGRGFGLIVTILLGMAGGWLGDMLFKNYLSFTSSHLVNHIICAAAGAVILCGLLNLISGRDKVDRTQRRS